MFNATLIRIPSRFKHKRPICIPTHPPHPLIYISTHSPTPPTHLSTCYFFSHSDIYPPLIHPSASHSHTAHPSTLYTRGPISVLELAFLKFQGRTCRGGCVTDIWPSTWCLLCPCVAGAGVSFRNPEGPRTVASPRALRSPWWNHSLFPTSVKASSLGFANLLSDAWPGWRETGTKVSVRLEATET